MVVQISPFPVPFLPTGPPADYGWDDRPISQLSTTTAFNTGLDHRDVFLGTKRCVVCGVDQIDHAHIIPKVEDTTWRELKLRNWLPTQAKSVVHESRNGLLMCPNHHRSFDNYEYFIRFIPEARKFLFLNFSNKTRLQQFHGKYIALDATDRHAPYPSSFIIHEMRVRGHHPFQPADIVIPDGDLPFQDWVSEPGILNETGSFNRDWPAEGSTSNTAQRSQDDEQFTPPSHTEPNSGHGYTITMNNDVVASILAATRSMPSWKATQIEGQVGMEQLTRISELTYHILGWTPKLEIHLLEVTYPT